MGIGVSVFLIALGLILALAVNVQLSGLDLHTVGWILTLVGVGGLIWTLVLWNRARPAVPGRVVVRETPVIRETPVVRERPVRRAADPTAANRSGDAGPPGAACLAAY